MKLENKFFEIALPVSVEHTMGNEFKIKIDGSSIFVTKDEWDDISTFISNSMNFIDDNL